MGALGDVHHERKVHVVVPALDEPLRGARIASERGPVVASAEAAGLGETHAASARVVGQATSLERLPRFVEELSTSSARAARRGAEEEVGARRKVGRQRHGGSEYDLRAP